MATDQAEVSMRRRARSRTQLVAAVLALAFAAASGASVPTIGECLEASDFIANAARARDYGMTRDAFLARMDEDFQMIHAFPPSLRWFAQDADDEAFLLAQARSVFESPDLPERHRAMFLGACFARLTV
jgi:hypothetical protein